MAMEAGALFVELRQQQGQPQSNEDLQQQNATESAIKKGNEEQGTGKCNLEGFSEEDQGSGRTPPSAGDEEEGIGQKRIQRKPPPATLEEALPSRSVGRYSLRLSTTRTAKDRNRDHINSELLEFSEDDSESCGAGVAVKQLRNAAKPPFIWGIKKRRTDHGTSSEVPHVTALPESNQANRSVNSRDRGCCTEKSQHGMVEWLVKRRRNQSTKSPQYFDSYNGREAAAPRTPAELLQNDISSSKEQHPRQSLRAGRSVGGRKVTPRSSLPSVGRIGSSCKLKRPVNNMVTHIESFQRELGGGRHEGSAATHTKPPARKRKAGMIANEFPQANALDALSNRHPRSDGTERAVLQQCVQLSSERGEVAGHCGLGVADGLQQSLPPCASRQFLQNFGPFYNGTFPSVDPQLRELGALSCGQFSRPGTSVKGSQIDSGRETTPPPPLDDRCAYIGSHSHSNSQLGGGVLGRDGFSVPREPNTNDSLGTVLSEARLSSEEYFCLSACHSAYHYEIDNVDTQIPTSSYPSRSRRNLSFRSDGAPQRVGSGGGAPPAPPNVATQPLSNMSAMLQANSIQDNQHVSLRTGAVPPMDDAGVADLDGDEDYEPDEGNLLDEEEDKVGGQRLFDLNETPEEQQRPRKNARARKKHRPKVFREGRPDRRRKPKNAEEGVSKTKGSEGTKVDVKPKGRKNRATSDLQSTQGVLLGQQGDQFRPVAANCGPEIDGCAQCQGTRRISDPGSCVDSQETQAMGTEDLLQSRGDSSFLQSESPRTPAPDLMLVRGPRNSLISARVLGDLSSPNARDCSALATSAYESPSPSRKGSSEDDRLGLAGIPVRRTQRELFKNARSKRSTDHSKDHSGWGENDPDSLMQAIAHPSAISATKTVRARPLMRTDASNSMELVPFESTEPSMALCDPAAELVGADLSIKCNLSNSEEGVSGESSIISREMGLPNGSAAIPDESVLTVNRARMRDAARAKGRPSNGLLDLVVKRMVNMDLEEIDSGLQIVPHANQSTAIVPFMPLRRKKSRAKVMLDGEDKRVWQLLMTQGTNFEDTSEKKAPRQWEEERATMKARAEKFINRMHLVQGDRRFSVWKGSVVDSVVGAFLTQNVSDHLSSSAFMCLAARFPVARKKKAAAATSQEATVTEVQVEEAFEISLKAFGIPTSSDGADGIQEGTMTVFHVEEACDISEKSSTGEGLSICYNQHDTLSTKLTDNERGREPTAQPLRSPIQEYTGTKHYDSEERLTETRAQNSSCSSKTSQNQCNSCVHNATSQVGYSLEVTESEEQKTCRVVEDYTSLQSVPEDVFLAFIGQDFLVSVDSTLPEDVGKREVTKMAMPAHKNWTQTDSEMEGSIFVDLSCTVDDLITDLDSPHEAIPNCLYESAKSSRTHEIGGNSIPQTKNCSFALPGLHMTCAAAEEIAASSSSMVSSSDSLDANKMSQSSAIPVSDTNLVIGEEIGAHTARLIVPSDSFDTNNSYGQQLVISLEAEPSEYLHQQLDVSCTTQSSPLRALKSLIRKKARSIRKGRQQTGPKSLVEMNNSEVVNSTSDDQDKEARGRKKRPVLSLTGIDRARLEQSNISSKVAFDWEAVRLKYMGPEMGENQHDSSHAGCKSFGSSDVENGVDWDAVRSAKLEDIAAVIKERGMNNVLAGRIKAFLERVQKEHGSVDLEWLRTVSVEEAKSFLLSVRGLGLKSVECIRLLTLHHLAFPVDTNVGRICVRLGWVPLEPLPEELQLHLLELYPVQETIQKYLWPRLCTLDQRTLYELHYQMITFGKVFCTKSRPNCNACPMRDDCRHFASALASSRLALPAAAHEDSHPTNSELLALPAAAAEFMQKAKLAWAPSEQGDGATREEGVVSSQSNSSMVSQKPCEPIIEEPRTPEPEIGDIEEYDPFAGVSSRPSGSEKGSSSEIEFVLAPAEVLIPDSASKALVVLPPDTASIPVPKLKNVGRLRTVHYVYELPDNHPLVQEMDPREDDDPCFYLLAIWSSGESPHAPPALDDMYTNGTCDGFNSSEEETVKGTVLVPCRTAMRGIFPLNGTYFQVNEVFADHASSLQPIEVPRTLLWNLRRRFVYFGTSVTTIFKGLSTEEIQACFWRGYVCVRGFDSVSRCPRPLAARLHFPASKMASKQKGEKNSPSNDED